MALTYFYAEWIGLFIVVLSIAMLANRRSMMQTILELVNTRAALFSVGIITLVMGILMVLTHNVWTGGALAIAVTVVGWVSLIRGTLLLILPHGTIRKIFHTLKFEQTYYAIAALMLVLGIYLAWSGMAGLGA